MAIGQFSPCFLYQPNAKLAAAAAHQEPKQKDDFFAKASDEELKAAGYSINYLPPASPWMLEQIHGNKLLWAEGLDQLAYEMADLPAYLEDHENDEAQAFYMAAEGGLAPAEIYEHGNADGWDEGAEAAIEISQEEELWDELAEAAQADADLKAAYQEALS